MAERITWEDDIKDFFTQMDVGCMRARGLDLSDYETVKTNADRILDQLKRKVKNPNTGMPKGDRAWPAEKIEAFETWKDDCAPETKDDPGPPCPGAPAKKLALKKPQSTKAGKKTATRRKP